MRWALIVTGAAVMSVLVVWSYLQTGLDAAGSRQGLSGEAEGEIWVVVDRAVVSLEYSTADSKADLERILAETYAGPLLTELVTALQGGAHDDVVPVQIINRRSVEIYGHDARAEVDVFFRDWADGSEWYGTGVFTLARMKRGWRIVDYDYRWECRAPAARAPGLT